MERNIKVLLALLAAALLIVSFAGGCVWQSSPAKKRDSSNSPKKQPVIKVDTEKWEKQLPTEIISIFPIQGGLARLYGKVENKSKQDFELVRIAAVDIEQKEIAAVTLEDLDSNETRTFDMQTAMPIADIETPTLKIKELRMKTKP